MKEFKENQKIEFYIDLMFNNYEQIMTLQSTNIDMTTKFSWESVNQYRQKYARQRLLTMKLTYFLSLINSFLPRQFYGLIQRKASSTQDTLNE